MKVTVKDQEAIINTSRNDLMKLNAKTTELALKVNTAHQKVEHEVAINMSIHADKKKVEQKLSESIAEVEKLKDENSKLEEEMKQSKMKNKELEKKLSEFESGSTFNQNI